MNNNSAQVQENFFQKCQLFKGVDIFQKFRVGVSRGNFEKKRREEGSKPTAKKGRQDFAGYRVNFEKSGGGVFYPLPRYETGITSIIFLE
jgi:hypothetical protein